MFNPNQIEKEKGSKIPQEHFWSNVLTIRVFLDQIINGDNFIYFT